MPWIVLIGFGLHVERSVLVVFFLLRALRRFQLGGWCIATSRIAPLFVEIHLGLQAWCLKSSSLVNVMARAP